MPEADYLDNLYEYVGTEVLMPKYSKYMKGKYLLSELRVTMERSKVTIIRGRTDKKSTSTLVIRTF